MDGAVCGTDAGNAVDFVGVVCPDAIFGTTSGFADEVGSDAGKCASAVRFDGISGIISGSFSSGPDFGVWFTIVDCTPPDAVGTVAPVII